MNADPLARIRAQLTRLRLDAGLTQGALARRMHISAAAVSMYESGRRTPTADRLADWAGALDVVLMIGVPRG